MRIPRFCAAEWSLRVPPRGGRATLCIFNREIVYCLRLTLYYGEKTRILVREDPKKFQYFHMFSEYRGGYLLALAGYMRGVLRYKTENTRKPMSGVPIQIKMSR